jgi:hypothetical protein
LSNGIISIVDLIIHSNVVCVYIYIYIYPDQGDDLEEVTDERPRVGQNEFRVICGALSGMLHKSRFASGIRVYLSTYS